jgi:CheY-like chemotaxis protein
MTAQQANETILVVDDEPPIRRLIRHALEREGYKVLDACNGHEALDLARVHPGPIDLLIADVVMPVMDGFTLVTEFVEMRSETRVLFVTGQADQAESLRHELQDSEEAYLLKPFTFDRLRQTIRDRLNTTPRRRPTPDRTTIEGRQASKDEPVDKNDRQRTPLSLLPEFAQSPLMATS